MYETYTAYRFYRNSKKRVVMKRSLTLEKVREFCSSYPDSPRSLVGFLKD